MPITPRYDWSQDFDTVSLRIHGPGLRAEHLQVSDLYLGLNSAPYLLGLDLYQSVKSEDCEVAVLQAALQIKLAKTQQGLWPELCYEGDPEQKRIRRRQTLESAREREEQKRKKMLQETADAKLKAQKRVWDEEDKRRSLIEQLKHKEENQAKTDVAQWAESNESRTPHAAKKPNSSIFECREDQAAATLIATKDNEPDNKVGIVGIDENQSDPEGKRRLPGVRNNPAVLVRFTAISDRRGPVARDPNEDDEFAVLPPISSTPDDVTEGHAQLLFEKGEKFQNCNDYLSAISAFSAVLNMSSTNAPASLNRARCYLKLAAFRGAALMKKFERIRKCIADCNLVLAGKCPAQLRSELLRTRAQANVALGNFASSISDYEDAVNCAGAAAEFELISELEHTIAMWNERQNQEETADLDHIHDLPEISAIVNLHPCGINYITCRAKIHAALGQHDQAVDDLTECLAIIDDPVLGRQVPDNVLDETTANICQLRGEALLALDRHRQAGDDFSSAIHHGLNPDRVRHHLSSIQERLAVNRSEPADQGSNADACKDQLQLLLDSAASSFKSGDVIRAKRLFSDALRLNPPKEVQSQILSNRAATELYLQQYDACIRDSTSCLELGCVNDPVRQATTLSRRAAAYTGMGSLDSAQDDLRAALSLLQPGSAIAQQITEDLHRLTQYTA